MTALSLDRPADGIAQHVRETVRLAVPVMLARCGLIIMITVDTLMVGRSGGAELAHFAIAYAPQITMLTVGIGLLVGTVVLTAQAVGAGRHALAGRIWRLALLVGGSLGCVYAVALLYGEAILLALGQTPGLAAAGGRVTAMWAVGMPGLLLYVATSSFLEGISRPKPGMVIMLGANLLNAGLNWAMVFGHLGLPAMGAEGAVLGTSITRWVMFAAILAYVLRMPRSRGLRRLGAARRPLRADAEAAGARRAARAQHRLRILDLHRGRDFRRLARRRTARRLPDRHQRQLARLHAGDRPLDRDRGPGRQCGRARQFARRAARRLGRYRACGAADAARHGRPRRGAGMARRTSIPTTPRWCC